MFRTFSAWQTKSVANLFFYLFVRIFSKVGHDFILKTSSLNFLYFWWPLFFAAGCRYVFTSSAQLHAHKRKHDKTDVPATLSFSSSPLLQRPASFSQLATFSSNHETDSDDDDGRPTNSAQNYKLSSDDEEDQMTSARDLKQRLWDAAKRQEDASGRGSSTARFDSLVPPRAR